MFGSLVLGRQEGADLEAPLTSKNKQRPRELFPPSPRQFFPFGKGCKTKDSDQCSGNTVDGVLRKSQK